MKDTNRYRIDVLLAIARITDRAEIRETVIDEVLLLLPNTYCHEKHAGGRPNDRLESAKADILQIIGENEKHDCVVLGSSLRKEMLKRGHADSTINKAKQELLKDEIIVKTHNGECCEKSNWIYTFY